MGSRRANGLDDADDPADYPPELARLPPGRHGLAREFVEENQRRRLISGLAIAAAEHGYRGATIAHITQRAAVSRRTFYEHFASKDECFAAAYEAVIGELRDRVNDAFDAGGDWPDALGEAIRAALRFLSENPSLAR